VLELAPGPPERLAAGLVAVLPHPTGRRLGGLPRDPRGFIPVDPHGGVLGVPDVYAAGDATTHPIRQGGLAAQQAEAVATTIAARAGAPVEPAAFRPVLRGTLVAGAARRWMHADIGAGLGTGRAACSSEPLWSEPGGHVVAPRLAALLRRCGQSRRGGAASPDAAG
jgi:sulfide:quinone oxidoreductase